MVDSYTFGRVVVDGVPYDADVILFPDRVEANWWRAEGHRLRIEDLGTVLEYGPEILVIGTGGYGGMEVPASTADALRARGVEPLVAPTEDACRKFNALLAEGKRVAAALHLTC